jgi:hypothetical protein
MKKITLVLLLLWAVVTFAQAPTKNQYGFTTKPTGTTPAMEASAIVDFSNISNKGVLLPRLTTTQKNSIFSPVNGLIVYDTTLGAYSYYNGSVWQQFSTGGAQDFDEVLTVGNTTDNHAIFTASGDTGTDIWPTNLSIYDTPNQRGTALGLGSSAMYNTASGYMTEWGEDFFTFKLSGADKIKISQDEGIVADGFYGGKTDNHYAQMKDIEDNIGLQQVLNSDTDATFGSNNAYILQDVGGGERATSFQSHRTEGADVLVNSLNINGQTMELAGYADDTDYAGDFTINRGVVTMRQQANGYFSRVSMEAPESDRQWIFPTGSAGTFYVASLADLGDTAATHVPYTGATDDVALGGYTLTADNLYSDTDVIAENEVISGGDMVVGAKVKIVPPPTTDNAETKVLTRDGSSGYVEQMDWPFVYDQSTGFLKLGSGTPSQKFDVTGNGIFSGTFSASNLSGTNTGDNATNTTSNTYADGKVANDMVTSTTVAPSKAAVIAADALKATIGGDAKGSAVSLGTTDNNNVSLVRNSTAVATFSTSAVSFPNAFAIQNMGNSGRFSMTVGNSGIEATATRNIADSAPVMSFDLANAGSTATSILTLKDEGTVRFTTNPAGTPSATTDIVRFGDIGTTNATTTGLSSATLNSTYPNVPVGYTVVCGNITLGGATYIKYSEAGSSDVWVIASTPVVP